MIKGVLFDMDGVLLDSEHLTSQAAINYFAKKGFAVEYEDFIPFYGTGEKGFFCGVAAKYGIPYNNATEAHLIYHEYEKLAAGQIQPLPGVVDFITLCRQKNLKLAVATSAGRLKMKINLQRLGFDNVVFDALVCGYDIANNKPHPEIFITAAAKLGLSPNDCLVVEDAPSGVKAAKDSGAKCLALTTSVSEELLTDADWIVKNLTTYSPVIFSQ